MARDHLIELTLQAKDEASDKIAGVTSALDGLGDDEVTINLALRAADLVGQIDDLRVEMSSLSDPVELNVKAENLAKLTGELEAVEDAIRNVGRSEVDIDTRDTVRNLDDLSESLDKIEDQAAKQIRLDIEAQRAAKDIRDLERDIESLIREGANEVEIRAKVEDLARAKADLEDLQALAKEDYDIDININQRGGRRGGGVRDVGDDLEFTRQKGEGLQSAIPAIRGFGDELGGTAQSAGIASQAIADLGDFSLIAGERFATSGSKFASTATKLGTVLGAAGLGGAIAGIAVQLGGEVIPAIAKFVSGQAEIEAQTKEATEAIEGQFNVLQGLNDLYPDSPILEAYLGSDEAAIESGIDLLKNFTFGLGELREEKQSLDASPEDTISRWLDDINLDVPEEVRDRLAEIIADGGDAASALLETRLENQAFNISLSGNDDRYFDLQDDIADVVALRNELSAPIDEVLTTRLESLAEFTGTAVGNAATAALADIESGAVSVEDAYLGVIETIEGVSGSEVEMDNLAEATKRVGEEADRSRTYVDEFAAAEQAAARQAEALAAALNQADLEDFISNTSVRRAEAFGEALADIDATDVGEPFRAARDAIRGFGEYVKSDKVDIGTAIENSLDGTDFSDKFIAQVDQIDDALQTGLVAAFESGGSVGALGFYDSFVADLEAQVGAQNAAAILERAGFTAEEVEARIKVAVDRQALDDVVQLMALVGVDSPEARQLLIDIALGDVSATEATLRGYEVLTEEGYDIPLKAYADAAAVATTEEELDAIAEAREAEINADDKGSAAATGREIDKVAEKDRPSDIDVSDNGSAGRTKRAIERAAEDEDTTIVVTTSGVSDADYAIDRAADDRDAIIYVHERFVSPRAQDAADGFVNGRSAQTSTTNVTVNLPRAAEAREVRSVLERFSRLNGGI